MNIRNSAFYLVCWFSILLGRGALAEDRSLTTSGSLRWGGWSSNRKLDNQTDIGVPSVWLNSKWEFSENSKIVMNGWARKEGLAPAPQTSAMFREAYLQSNWGDWEFSIGRKLFLWGRADGINPTDNLSPRNFTLLVPDDSDQRKGTYSASIKLYKGDHSFQIISIPYFVGNTVPIPDQGFPFSTKVQTVSGIQNSFAVKWEKIGGNWDWSLSYYQGYDLNPDLGIRTLPRSILNQSYPNPIDLYPDFTIANSKLAEGYSLQTKANYNRIHVYGGDISTVIGKYSLRGETAFVQTVDTNGKNLFVKNPNWQTVVGGDRNFLEYLNINIQYIYKRTFFLQDPNLISDPYERAITNMGQTISNQLVEHLHGGSLRISYKWFHETLEGEITYVNYFNRGDSLIRPKLKYAINDSTYWIFGGDFFSGPKEGSFFGFQRRNTGVFTEVQWFF